MEEKYYKEKTEPLILVSQGKLHQMDVKTADEIKPFAVTVLQDFTAEVLACENLNAKQKSSIRDFIEERAELISDELAKWISENIDIEAYDCVQAMFTGLPDLQSVMDVLVDILIKLPI